MKSIHKAGEINLEREPDEISSERDMSDGRRTGETCETTAPTGGQSAQIVQFQIKSIRINELHEEFSKTFRTVEAPTRVDGLHSYELRKLVSASYEEPPKDAIIYGVKSSYIIPQTKDEVEIWDYGVERPLYGQATQTISAREFLGMSAKNALQKAARTAAVAATVPFAAATAPFVDPIVLVRQTDARSGTIVKKALEKMLRSWIKKTDTGSILYSRLRKDMAGL